MKKSKYKKTGFAFDERNQRDYNTVTRLIEKALADIETNLASFKSKPTQKHLANKAKCSVETLIHRSKLNSISSSNSEILGLNENVLDHGISNDKNNGWPLSEIKRLQNIFRSIRQEKLKKNNPIPYSDNSHDVTNQESAVDPPDNISRMLSNLRGQNAQLFMENEDLKSKLRNAESSLSRVENTCTALKETNSELYEKIAELQENLKSQRKAIFTVVKNQIIKTTS